MKQYFLTVLILFSSIFIIGCAQKVKIKAFEPAQIDRITTTKKIAVMSFENDSVGLSSKIESKLARFKMENKPFFTILSRSDINDVIREQKIQNSGLVDTKEIVEVGALIGAQALISGEVNRPSVKKTHYYESRVECADKKCKEMYRYDVSCMKRYMNLSATIKIVDITRGDIVYAQNLSKSSEDRHCRDSSYALASEESVIDTLASRIASDFTYKLTPHYRYFEVELLEKPDLDYNEDQELLFESALKYIKHSRYEKASQLLKELIDSTNQESYVAFYNLGVIEESLGNYEKAKRYYEKADNLTLKPVQEIDNAYVRINSIIEKHTITKQQLSR